MGAIAKRTILICSACCALVLAVATYAVAAPTWLGPLKLSPAGQEAEGSRIVTDAHSDTTAVWERYTGSNWLIEAANRPAGSGAWQTPVPVSTAGLNSEKPQVGIDAQGDAVAVWSHREGSEFQVQASLRTGLNGAWQTPVTLSPQLVAGEPKPQVAVASNGDAVVTWRQQEGSAYIVEAASRPAGSAAWQAPVQLSKSGTGEAPAAVAISASGEATAVWEQDEGGSVVIEATSGASGKWQAPLRISPSPEGHNANEPRVAVDAQGNVLAVWERFVETEIIESATNQVASGKWQPPLALSKPEMGKEPGAQQVALDGHGDAVVVWQRSDGKNEIVEVTVGKPASGSWQPPVPLSAAGENAYAPQVGLDAQGAAVVVWTRSNGTYELAEAATGQAVSGAWQPPIRLSEEGGNVQAPQIALDAQGDAAAIWQRSAGTSLIVEADGYDAAGPLLNSLAIPSSGSIGQVLSFAVSPLDVWSALGTTSWSFGDGTSGAGVSLTHAYAKAGTYAVTVSSADVLGNTTSAGGTLTIAPGTAIALPLAPRISGAHLSHARFRVSKRATAVVAKLSQGTIFHFTLSQAAKLQIKFTRPLLRGLRSGKRCLAPSSKLRLKHAKRCTRTIIQGTLTRANEPQGADSVPFSGRIGNRALTPGTYRAVLSASSNGLNSVPVALSLTIVR